MTWTHTKHILLGALIVLSLFLSFSLLTTGSQSNEQTSSSGGSTTPALVDRSISEVFSPSQIILHEAYDNHQIASLSDTQDLVKQSYKSMRFKDVQPPKTLTRSEYQQMVHEDSWVEFIFDEKIPFGLFSEGFEDIPSDYENRTFNRVLFNLNNQSRVLFYNDQEEQTYEFEEVRIPEDLLARFRDTESIRYTEATGLELNHVTYVPSSKMDLSYENYIVERLPDRLFIGQFFEETSEVNVRSTSNGQQYTSLTTEVVINDENYTLSYLRQRTNREELSLTERLANSFQELAKVENWKDRSRYKAYNSSTGEVVFQRYLNGMPIFSAQQLDSEVALRIDRSGMKNLRLPLRIAQTPISLDGYDKKELPGGQEIADKLEAAGVDLSTVTGLKVGLTWEESEEDERVIHLEPDWYVNVKNDSNWYTVDQLIELQGESLNGL